MALRVVATILLLIVLVVAALAFAPGPDVQAHPPQGLLLPPLELVFPGQG